MIFVMILKIEEDRVAGRVAHVWELNSIIFAKLVSFYNVKFLFKFQNTKGWT